SAINTLLPQNLPPTISFDKIKTAVNDAIKEYLNPSDEEKNSKKKIGCGNSYYKGDGGIHGEKGRTRAEELEQALKDI
ncbi:hypothetical protein ABTF26_21960, partial [Acinetobacter baumannii]